MIETTMASAANDNTSGLLAWGSKAESVCGIGRKDVAKLIRADISAAIASGLLPAGLKVSVRVPVYSMAKAIDVRVTAFPGVFVSVKRVRHDLERPHDFSRDPQYTPEGRRVLNVIDAICEAYQSGYNDSQSDYFGERFSFGAEYHWELAAAQRAEIVAALKATAGVGAPTMRAV